MGIVFFIIGLALLIFNKPWSFYVFQHSRWEHLQIWNIRERTLIVGAFFTAYGSYEIYKYFTG